MTLTCNTLGGDVVFTGTVDGNHLTFANEMGGTCEGTISGDQVGGTCTSAAGTCNWNATLR